MNVSIIEYFSDNDGSSCGYCKGKKSSFTHGMWAHFMTVEDYQDLIDRGWRRSGQYCYKPTLKKTCCPQYTIRANAMLFKPSKSHKKVMKKFRRYIIDGDPIGKTRVLTPTASTNPDPDHEVSNEKMMDLKSTEMEAKLKMNNISHIQTNGMEVDSRTRPEPEQPKPSTSHGDTSASKRIPKPGSGADPAKPKCRKAKDFRRERALNKLEAKGIKIKPTTPKNEEKTLEDYLFSSFPSNSKHKFEMRTIFAQTSDPEFMSSFDETVQVYKKYQVTVHKDSISECSPQQFTRFLCNSSLIFVDDPFVDESTHTTVATGYGAFHQQYLIDGKIVCVGVLDILPRCVSSVYLYYDPDYSFLSLGTLSSLFEIAFVRRLCRIRPTLSHYYMGFYIHSCPKMRYKAQYLPSDIVCPETFEWVPVEKCLPLLDKSKYSRLSPDGPGPVQEMNIDKVGILYRRQRLEYGLYRQLRFPEDDDESDDDRSSDVNEVQEYSNLVGSVVSKRMLLYRS